MNRGVENPQPYHRCVTSEWGQRTFGEPCRECGYSWSLDPVSAISRVASAPADFRRALEGASGEERSAALTWSVKAYVFHVADNLRIWAERVEAAATSTAALEVAEYDSDLLAEARGYERSTVAESLVSLDAAASRWRVVMHGVVVNGDAGTVLLHHPARGMLGVEDIVRTNCHDTSHHLFDVRRILGAERR